MTRSIAIAAGLAIAASYSLAAQPTVPSDENLIAAVIGRWCLSDDGGKTCATDEYEEFKRDGTIVVWNKDDPEGKNSLVSAKYKVKGRVTCFTVFYNNTKEQTLPVGHQFCTELLSIDSTKQTYRHLDSGETYTTFRVKPMSPAPRVPNWRPTPHSSGPPSTFAEFQRYPS